MAVNRSAAREQKRSRCSVFCTKRSSCPSSAAPKRPIERGAHDSSRVFYSILMFLPVKDARTAAIARLQILTQKIIGFCEADGMICLIRNEPLEMLAQFLFRR